MTTLAAGLVAAGPDGSVLVEADPAGGAVASWWGLPVKAGLAKVAAATGRSVTAETVAGACQALAGGPGRVLVAPPSTVLCTSMLTVAAQPLAAVLGQLAELVVVDVGRSGPGSAVWPLVEAADVAVVVCRPRLPEVLQVPDRVAALEGAAEVGVVCVGRRPYGAGEVAAFAGAPVLGVIADDPSGAAAFAPEGSRRVLAHSPWWRCTRGLVDALVAGNDGDRRSVARAVLGVSSGG